MVADWGVLQVSVSDLPLENFARTSCDAAIDFPSSENVGWFLSFAFHLGKFAKIHHSKDMMIRCYLLGMHESGVPRKTRFKTSGFVLILIISRFR